MSEWMRTLFGVEAGDIPEGASSRFEFANLPGGAAGLLDGRDYARGAQLDVTFSSLPTPSFPDQVRNFFDGRGYLIAIAWAAGIVMLGLLAYAYFFAKHRGADSQTGDIAAFPEYAELERSEIVETIASLDKQHEAGEIEEDEYTRRRAALTDAALSARVTEAQPT